MEFLPPLSRKAAALPNVRVVLGTPDPLPLIKTCELLREAGIDPLGPAQWSG